MKISIKNKITIAMLVVILTSVSSLGFFAYKKSKEILIEDIKHKNFTTLDNIYNYFFQNFMEGMEYTVNHWADNQYIVSYKKNPGDPKTVNKMPEGLHGIANKWKGIVEANPDIGWMYFGVQEDGSFLISPIDPSITESYDPREREWYIQATENPDRVIWTDPYVDAGESSLIVVTVAKAVLKQDDLVGVIGIDIKLDKFSEITKNLVFGDEGYLMLISNEGDIYAHPDDDLLMDTAKNEDWFQEILMGDSGTKMFTSTEGKNKIITYLTIPQTNWKLVGITTVDIIEMITPIKNQVVMIALISIAIAFIIGYILSLIVTRPVGEIMKVIHKISKGEMGVRADIQSRDEFKVLGNKFNEMLVEIEGLLKERDLNVKKLIDKNKEIMGQNDEILAFSEETEALNEELSYLLNEIRNNYLSTVKALANSIEAKDSYTRGHCERVRNISLAIGKVMGLNQEEINNLEFASLLHDIGKIGIPLEILNKEGFISAEALETVQKHPQIAYNILSDVEFLKESREIIYQHHERVDGKGYPRGLKGEEISLPAKILAVADAYDAMTSTRPYRKISLTKEEALEELEAVKGRQLDIEVVDTFIKILKENQIEIDA
ncbi:HD-GYP domain [Natronincola peptidivorans]|uniref:HD-GYP domain n=1 Tax=Natronincola peptidivorans TaxID=426128 RepID=A0A1I0AUM7_9FIRM|nr:HD domain-containing phosphohydrolase [Natronincola peptidivorans]SES97284.1 HD-GYP domain [Natronincola peptidivorans]